MDSNLNNYFVTYKVYQDDNEVYQTVCPRSLIRTVSFMIIETFSKNHVIKIFDCDGNLRMDFRLFDKLDIIQGQ
jgi:hypothetical protein